MRYKFTFAAMGLALFLFSCKKEHRPDPVVPPATPVKHFLLKDITIPNLPSPYYHFEYNPDSVLTKASFASDYTMYDVLYAGGKISEMRNNIIVNHDTLRYMYDQEGRLFMILFKNQNNVVYRHANFMYNGDLVKEIQWDQKQGSVGFIIDRTLSFTYYTDGNVKTVTDHRPPVNGSDEYTYTTTFEQYDDKVNVDDFSLIHDGIHDHLFLLQGFRLQKNNPKKETLAVNGTNFYTVDYTYNNNSDGTPSAKLGDFVYLSGQYSGQRFQTQSYYTYY